MKRPYDLGLEEQPILAKKKYTSPEALVQARFTDAANHPDTAYSGSTAKLLAGLKGADRERGLDWLQRQEAYVITRNAPRAQGKFPRQKIIVSDVGDCFEIDLADMGPKPWMIRLNKGYRFILVVIDQLSRYVWAEPLKTKTGEEVAQAFDRILQRARISPKKLASDHGGEFYNRAFTRVLKKWDIVTHYSPSDEILKCVFVERVIRSLKNITTRYFIQNNSYKWYNALQDIIKTYNYTRHSVLKTSPVQVLYMDAEEIEDLWQRLYGKPLNPKQQKALKKGLTQFKVGDRVRISLQKAIFEKGYTPAWSRQIYRVYARKYAPYSLLYKVMDLDGSPVPGVFYREQLRKHIGPSNIGQVIDDVVHDDPENERVTVSFLGWDPKFNQTMSYNQYDALINRQYNQYGRRQRQQQQDGQEHHDDDVQGGGQPHRCRMVKVCKYARRMPRRGRFPHGRNQPGGRDGGYRFPNKVVKRINRKYKGGQFRLAGNNAGGGRRRQPRPLPERRIQPPRAARRGRAFLPFYRKTSPNSCMVF